MDPVSISNVTGIEAVTNMENMTHCDNNDTGIVFGPVEVYRYAELYKTNKKNFVYHFNHHPIFFLVRVLGSTALVVFSLVPLTIAAMLLYSLHFR